MRINQNLSLLEVVPLKSEVKAEQGSVFGSIKSGAKGEEQRAVWGRMAAAGAAPPWTTVTRVRALLKLRCCCGRFASY